MDRTTHMTSEIPKVYASRKLFSMDRTTDMTSEEDNDAGGSAPQTDTSQTTGNKGFTYEGMTFHSGFELSEVKEVLQLSKIIRAKNMESPEYVQKREIARAKILEGYAHVKPLNDSFRGRTYCNATPAYIEIVRRKDRKSKATDFRNCYIYGACPDGPCTIPNKTERIPCECFKTHNCDTSANGCTNPYATTDGCTEPFAGTREKRICIGSKDHCFWKEKSSGIMWVCVHGMDSVCVVTRSGDLDWRRVRSGHRWTDVGTVLSNFRISIISEIEDLVDTPSEPLNRTMEKPFGVVCVPDTKRDLHNECGHEA